MRISLYVPCYNGAAWLAECLDALLAQTHPFDELLVVDDGSTDQSAAIVRRYEACAAGAGRVRLVQHPRNLGLAVARNTALGAASGELVASVDADVKVTPTWLGRLLAAFDSPRVAAVGGRLVEGRQDHLADRWRAAHMAQHAGDFPLRNPPALAGANSAVRRDIVVALGGYETAFRTNYEDVDLQQRLQAAGYLTRYEPGAVAFHLRTDTARTVLRTYWNWLRPPFERKGAFVSEAGLLEKLKAGAERARRALWQDLGGGSPELAYLSLLMLLTFPAADRSHAAARTAEAGDSERAARLAGGASAWPARLPDLLRSRSPYLAECVVGDVEGVRWWPSGPPSPPSPAARGAPSGGEGGRGFVATGAATPPSPREGEEDAEGVLGPAIEALPRAWWPWLEGARDRLARDEGWTKGRFRAAGQPSQLGTVNSELGTPSVARPAARWLEEQAGDGVVAVIVHGADGRGEDLPWAPLELALVLDQLPAEGIVERWRRGVSGFGGRREVSLTVLAAHRIGWLPPSVLQQSLLAGAVLLWGDQAAVRAIPSWRPEQLDPRLALDELDLAQAALDAGAGRLATYRAAGALLVARRRYTPRHEAMPAALQEAWPEGPAMHAVPAPEFVATARALIRDWLFTWEDRGCGERVVRRYRAMRARAREVQAGVPALQNEAPGPPVTMRGAPGTLHNGGLGRPSA
ncbi:MAG TPA: glycosyltransferase family 2 protein [Chloroflexota bacterium]|nr:glycosyltransferase family 2 protein [Chloroflexota bacterium]